MFENELLEMTWDVFGSRVVRESGLFDMSKLRALLEQQAAGVDHYARLWRLLVLCTWLDLYKTGA